eukprot:CAMPEP_0117002588 /NCGR_PEP_ID=MMETSP0472-20121206/4206_1 /TAXON_ID=693140 ORGANISM="Tiarina fusus, Strain LIS" /NCGR_SAMPLE_ID=MMETSP0472 /ASSEMBLY_ACC=CAM_ASM_000603 /LENGTH=440 /DNA_ID=CAMNT_0004702983 /DNA_START=54 /DNA_END=1373 /DNA_ORIENTATION=+
MSSHSKEDASATKQKPHIDSERIVELASSFSTTDVGYGRDEHGRLAGWQEWAHGHPQKENTVHVCNGRHEWEMANDSNRRKGEDHQQLLSVVSWNTLSETWYELDCRSGGYAHTPREYGVWEGRFPLLIRWISRLRPDILVLQEVDFQRFDSHLLPRLREMGYEGLVQTNRKQRPDQPCGVATFWLRDKLELLTAHFRYKNNDKKHVCLANIHLESSQSETGANKRARQLNSPLEWAARVAPSSSVIVCGDCNTGADSSLFHVLRTHRWHGHDFASVYEHPATSETLPVNRATFAVPRHHYVIDHMLYSHDSTTLNAVLNALTRDEIDEHLGSGFDKGFPNEFCPSDHLPIGAVFDVRGTNDEADDTTASSRPPLGEGRRKELECQWQVLQAEKPPHRKGLPTPEEIEARREYSRKVKAWKSGFEGNVAETEFAEALIKG